MSGGMQVILGTLIGAALTGQTPVRTEDFKLVPSDADAGFGLGFGFSVAASDDWIVVGAPSDTEGGPWETGAGALYVYRREGEEWVEHAKLVSPPDQFEPQLGWAVATDGDRIVTAGVDLDFDDGPGPGALYVYRRDDGGTRRDFADDEWVFESRIAGEVVSMTGGERLGASVAVEGDVIVGGTAVQWLGNTLPGRAKVFRFDGEEWVQEALLIPDDTGPEDLFGLPVAIEGTTIVVGARGDDEIRRGGGAAYVFEHRGRGWTEVAKLGANAGQTPGGLAGNLSLTRGMTLLGGRLSDESLMRSGVILFRRRGRVWAQTQLLFPTDGGAAGFGNSVAVSPLWALVGATRDDHGFGFSGLAYLFQRHGREWVEVEKLVPSDPEQGAQLALTVVLAGQDAVVGGGSAGAVYVYSLARFKRR